MIRLNYEIQYAEYRQACRALWHAQPRGWSHSLQIAGYAAVCLGFLLLAKQSDMPRWLAAALLIAFGLYMLIQPIWSAYSQVEKRWNESFGFVQPIAMEIDDDGLKWTMPHGQSQSQWIRYTHFQETRDLFLLYHGRTDLELILPKRAFADARQIEEFRQLLREKLERPAPAFPVVPRP